MKSPRAPLLFLLLFAFWQLLSFRFDPLFLVIGVLSAGAMTWAALPLLEVALGPAHRRVHVLRLIGFSCWLVTRWPKACYDILKVVLDPRATPRPGVVHFRTGLSSPAARALLANAITFVPGTITIEVDGPDFTVHAFAPEAAMDLATAADQRRIARIFADEADEPPEMVWEAATELDVGHVHPDAPTPGGAA